MAEAPILSGKAPLHDQSRIEDVDDDDNDDVDDSNYPGFEGKLLSPMCRLPSSCLNKVITVRSCLRINAKVFKP